MPVSPELGVKLARRFVEIYSTAEVELLRLIARRTQADLDAPDWAERKLREVTVLRHLAQLRIRELTVPVPRGLELAVEKAFDEGYEEAQRELEALRLAPKMQFGRSNPALLRGFVEEAVTSLQSTHMRILRATEDIYRRVIADTAAQTLTGAATRRQASQMALNRFADRGITGFVDRAGRQWDLVSYAEMATRAATGRAAVSGHVETLVDAGQDLGIISDAPEECSICRPWEGRVVSFTGRSSEYPALDQARGEGLFHPGCRHSVGIYIKGLTQPMKRTADPSGDEERQQQRYLERQVRRWRRREAVGDPRARAKAGEWKIRLANFVEVNDRKRLAYREQVTSAR